jgi:hypothetical protein
MMVPTVSDYSPTHDGQSTVTRTNRPDQGVAMNATTSTFTDPPRWMEAALKIFNPAIIRMQRLGLAFGPAWLLTVPGRKSGKLRTTPVAPLIVAGERYLLAVYEETDWVANARAAGWGILARGRREERVSLAELSLADRTDLLRKLPHEAPQAAGFIKQRFGIAYEPEATAGLADKCRVFRIGSTPAA